MVNFLAKAQADKMKYRESNIFTIQEEPENISHSFEGPVNYFQRGSFRGRNKPRGSIGQQRQHL